MTIREDLIRNQETFKKDKLEMARVKNIACSEVNKSGLGEELKSLKEKLCENVTAVTKIIQNAESLIGEVLKYNHKGDDVDPLSVELPYYHRNHNDFVHNPIAAKLDEIYELGNQYENMIEANIDEIGAPISLICGASSNPQELKLCGTLFFSSQAEL